MITKGEWSSDYGDYSIFCETGAEIARVVPGAHDDGSVISDREMEANLELLAAAPALLEALRGLVARVRVYEEWASRELMADPKFNPRPCHKSILESIREHGALDDADAAIAKAEGKPDAIAFGKPIA